MKLLVCLLLCVVGTKARTTGPLSPTVKPQNEGGISGSGISFDGGSLQFQIPEENDDLFQGDIRLTKEQEFQLMTRKLTALDARLWSTGLTPTEVNYSLNRITDSGKRSAIEAGIDEWRENTCITFTESNTSPFLDFISSTGCWSYVGKVSTVSQEVSIGSGCESLGTVVHEIGHAMGLNHEQVRSDRDDYISILTDNIISGREGNFQKSNTRNLGTPYDYYSVMHYSTGAFTDEGFLTIVATTDPTAAVFMGQRSGLSFYDKKIANLAYNCMDKWMASCNITSDPCLNDGYIGSDCGCVCRPGASGTNCQNDDKDYYDAIDSGDLKIARTNVTSEGKIVSDSSEDIEHHIYHVQAPECHRIEFEVSDFDLYQRIGNSVGNSICYFEFLVLRTDLSTTSHSIYCDKEVETGTTFSTVGNEMIIESKLHPFLSSNWSGEITFIDTCNDLVKLQPLEGDCTFEKEGDDYYFKTPNYPEGNNLPFTCLLSFSSDSSVFYQLSVVEKKGRKSPVSYRAPSGSFTKLRMNGSVANLNSSSGELKISAKNPINAALKIKISPQQNVNAG